MRRLFPGWVKWPQLDFPLLLGLLLLATVDEARGRRAAMLSNNHDRTTSDQ